MSIELNRTIGTRSYKKRFFLSTEGAETEPAYFARLATLIGRQYLELKILQDRNKTSPKYVLRRLQQCKSLRAGDELWCVIDRDQWQDSDIQAILNWIADNANTAIPRGLALSSPKFELWLLAHFEELKNNPNISRGKVVLALQKHLPGYDKHLTHFPLTEDSLNLALKHCAEAFGNTLPQGNTPGTTVPKLIRAIRNAAKQEMDRKEG